MDTHGRLVSLIIGDHKESKMDVVLQSLPVVGRLLVGFFYLFFSIWNINNFVATVHIMVDKKIPLAKIILALGIILELVCSILILMGVYVKLAALLLIPFVIIVVNIFHPFWKFSGNERALNLFCYITHMTSSIAALILLMNNIDPNSSWEQLFM